MLEAYLNILLLLNKDEHDRVTRLDSDYKYNERMCLSAGSEIFSFLSFNELVSQQVIRSEDYNFNK